jgi:parallel beta-helix repeat protein
MIKKGRCALLFTLLAIAVLCGSALATEYYVATTGDDGNPGTEADPWATLQHAVDNVSPGDVILVKPGTYAGCQIAESGEPEAVCTLKAEERRSVVINEVGPRGRRGTNLEVGSRERPVKYWVIDGFEVTNARRWGIALLYTEYITVQHCYVHDCGSTGIFTAFAYYPTIQYNESCHNGEHGIYQSNSGDYPHIRGNRLHHNYACGVHMNGDINFQPGDGIISHAIVEQNVIWENGTGGGAAINMDGCSDGIVRNNLAYRNHASGIAIFAQDGAEGSSRNQVYNNTIVTAPESRWAVVIPTSWHDKPNPTGNTIVNNILFTPDSETGSIFAWGAQALAESDHNLVVDRFTVDDNQHMIGLEEWQREGQDQHSRVATPEEVFADVAQDDYRLRAGSPAIDAGIAVSEVASDLDGVSRPQGSRCDIGCYEAAASAEQPQPAAETTDP